MIKFTIPTQGYNAVPYKRTTQKQKFIDKSYKRYSQWKSYINTLFRQEFGIYPRNYFRKNKKYYMDIKIYFKNYAHGDSDNVFKGVADSLFAHPLNDKSIAGSFDFFYDKDNPRIEVEICTEEEKQQLELKRWQDRQNAEFIAKEFKELL